MYQPPADLPSPPASPERRKWLHAVIGVIIGAISSIVGVVVGGAVLAPTSGQRRETWVPAGRVADLPDGIPTAVTVRVTRQDGYYEAVDQHVVFLVKSEAGDVRALSSTCTHLGCRVSYDPVKKLIKYPCQGGVFAPDGARVSGPPPRGLPAISARVDGSRVFVQI